MSFLCVVFQPASLVVFFAYLFLIVFCSPPAPAVGVARFLPGAPPLPQPDLQPSSSPQPTHSTHLFPSLRSSRANLSPACPSLQTSRANLLPACPSLQTCRANLLPACPEPPDLQGQSGFRFRFRGLGFACVVYYLLSFWC